MCASKYCDSLPYDKEEPISCFLCQYFNNCQMYMSGTLLWIIKKGSVAHGLSADISLWAAVNTNNTKHWN